MKKNFETLYETLGGTPRRKRQHLPDVELPEQKPIGKYGRMPLILSNIIVAEGTPLC